MGSFYVGVALPASVLIPLGIGAVKRVYAQRDLRSIYVYLLLGGITNVVARAVGAAHINNLPLLHLYTILELLVLFWYFSGILRGKRTALFIKGMCVLFPVLAVLNFLLVQSIYTFNSYPRALSSVMIVALSLSYFLTEGSQTTGKQAHKWINFGLLQYFGSAVFMFAFSNVIYENASRQGQNIIGILHATLVLIMYMLVALGFLSVGKDR